MRTRGRRTTRSKCCRRRKTRTNSLAAGSRSDPVCSICSRHDSITICCHLTLFVLEDASLFCRCMLGYRSKITPWSNFCWLCLPCAFKTRYFVLVRAVGSRRYASRCGDAVSSGGDILPYVGIIGSRFYTAASIVGSTPA